MRRAFKVIEPFLLRALVAVYGYDTYVSLFYALAGAVLGVVVLAAWVAVVFKGSEPANPWLKR